MSVPMLGMPRLRRVILLSTLLCFAAILTGCGRPTYMWRYKLTLAVETPEGVKSGHSIVEIVQRTFWYENTLNTYATGEALYLHLGPGRRPLIALLTVTSPSGANRFIYTGSKQLFEAYGEKLEWNGGRNDALARAIEKRGVVRIGTESLPDLVTFADVSDPKSVMRVDPDDLTATLGPGVKWKSMTVELVSPGTWPLNVLGFSGEPLTTGIEQRLPWLANLTRNLAGNRRKTPSNLETILDQSDFIRAGY